MGSMSAHHPLHVRHGHGLGLLLLIALHHAASRELLEPQLEVGELVGRQDGLQVGQWPSAAKPGWQIANLACT